MLISEEYFKNRWKNFSFEKATPSAEVGKLLFNPKNLPKLRIFLLLINLKCSCCDNYFKRFIWKQSRGKRWRLFLNNEMDDFSKTGVLNMFGAVGGEANKIEPNKECFLR